MTNRARISVRSEHADVIARAISPESGEKIPRTRIALEEHDDGLDLVIEAEDLAAMRAALNSYIRWMNVAEETAKEASRI